MPLNPKCKKKGFLGVYLKSKEIQKKANEYIELNNIKVIEVPDWCGIAAFMRFKCKTVVKFHGSDGYFCYLEKRKQKRKNYFLEYKNLHNADVYISVSNFTAGLTRKLFRLAVKKITVLHNGVDLANFVPFENRERGDNLGFNILYLGTLIRKKGCLEIPHIANKVLEENPSAKFILVGPDASDIRSGNKSTWLMMEPLFNDSAKIHYLGAQPYEKVREIIASADVCVFPSYAEALPMTWLEAMAMKKPVVTSDIGWAEEIIVDGVNGYMANPKNHELYADKILKLLGSKELREEFGAEARKTVEQKFNILDIAIMHIDFFKDII